MRYQLVKVSSCAHPVNKYPVGYIYSSRGLIIKFDYVNNAYRQLEYFNTTPLHGKDCDCKYEVQEIE